MTLQQLKVFLLSVKLRKIAAVAKEMNLREPTILFHLQSLERDLGQVGNWFD